MYPSGDKPSTQWILCIPLVPSPPPMDPMNPSGGSPRPQLHVGSLNVGVLLVDAAAPGVRALLQKAESSSEVRFFVAYRGSSWLHMAPHSLS